MNPITSPEEPHPAALDLAAATTRHTQGRFTISSRKLPISKSGPIDDMSRRLGIPVPEMIFGDNLVAVRHDPTGWAVAFTAEAALDAVDKTGANMLQVAYAGEWSSSRERSSAHDIREVVKPYDWSYSTTYRGTEAEGRVVGGVVAGGGNTEAETTSVVGTTTGDGSSGSASNGTAATRIKKLIPVGGGPPPPPTTINGNHNNSNSNQRQQPSSSTLPPPPPSSKQIPLELLRRRDPILFFDEVVLFESELDDNGISVYSVKVRVMEQRMLLLARLYMRLDNVVARVRDTRVYVDFAKDEVIREYTAKEDSFANVKRVSFLFFLFFHNPFVLFHVFPSTRLVGGCLRFLVLPPPFFLIPFSSLPFFFLLSLSPPSPLFIFPVSSRRYTTPRKDTPMSLILFSHHPFQYQQRTTQAPPPPTSPKQNQADTVYTQGLLASGLLPDAVTSALRDANQVAPLLPIVEQQIDTVSLA